MRYYANVQQRSETEASVCFEDVHEKRRFAAGLAFALGFALKRHCCWQRSYSFMTHAVSASL